MIFLYLGTASFVFAQTGSIEGKVTNAETGEPVIGASVFVIEPARGGATDVQGKYVIADVHAGTYTLRVSFVGYKTIQQQVTILPGETVTQNIQLESGSVNLQELVVTALGIKRSKEVIGYSAQQISGEEISSAPVASVASALAGKFSGLKIVSSGGQPGAATQIVIRGANSITGNNQPLFVIDGVPIISSANGAPGAGALSSGSGSTRALDLDPSVIESVTVLKGGAATALYGSRASNGVIVITTKGGEEGPMRVNLSSKLRFDQAIMKGVQDEYLSGQYGYFANGLPTDKGGYASPDYISNVGTNPQTTSSWGPHKGDVPQQVLNALGVDRIDTYNHMDEFYQTGVFSQNSLSFSGGGDTGTYFISGSRLDQSGTVPTTSLTRSNLNLKVRKELLPSNLVSNTRINYVNSQREWQSSSYYSSARLTRMWPINLQMKPYEYSDGTNRTWGSATDSPFWQVNETGFTSDVNRLILSQSLIYEITPWLSITERFGLDTYDSKRENNHNRRKRYQDDGSMYNQKIVQSQINNDILLKVQKRNITEDFTITAQLGNHINMRNYSTTSVSGSGQNIPSFFDESNFNDVDGNSYRSSRHLYSFYGQATLGYGEYLFLTLTARNDWSSTLPKANRSYFYPSASLAFNFSELFDLSANSALSFGKLRASISRTGSDAPLYSLSTSYFSAGFGIGIQHFGASLDFPYNGISSFLQSGTLGNPSLEPEMTESYEVGIDLKLFDSRADISATYYSSSTSGQIYSTPVSAATGYTNMLRNAGKISNSGVNLTLGGTIIQNDNFQWNLSVNWSKNKGKVVSLAPGVNYIYLAGYSFPSIRASVGDGYGTIWGYKYKRNDAGQLIINDDPTNGDYGMPIIDNSQQPIGNIQPDWRGNIRTSFRYKGVFLDGLIDVRHGGDVLNFSLNYTIRSGMAEITENRGTQMTDPDKPGYIKPYVWEGAKASNGEPNDIKMLRNQDFWSKYAPVHENLVKDGSYIKLRQVTLGYNLPASILQNTPLRSASFSVTGRNLWIHTDFNTGDPEGNPYGTGNGGNGFYWFITPPSQSVMFSINLGF